jgi:alanyl-tRNA synthetase
VNLHVAASDDLVARGAQINQWIKSIAAHVQGGGGGQPFYASAGGKNPSGVSAARDAFKNQLSQL